MALESLSPHYVSLVWVGTAFAAGFLAHLAKLPPMIGFLLAGFALNFMGLSSGSLNLEWLAQYGIVLLLFTIGLKLDLKGLLRPEIWAGTTLHVLGSVIFFSGFLLLGSALGLRALVGLEAQQALLLGFGLSFSSTIFAVKTLEEKGEMAALHGRIAIGVLIMQDILAVLFVTVSKGELPSLWALALPLLLAGVRPLFFYIMDRSGHGELFILAGFFIAIVVGATSFALVGLKADLGALVFGALISGHPRASEMSKALYGFKDLFLVAFFLQIGLQAQLRWDQALLALGLLLLLPLKSFLYFVIFTRFRLRARTSFLATVTLSNYSIFGLLVVSIASKNGWLGSEWLVILSLALTYSFIVGAPLSGRTHACYDRFSQGLKRLEREGEHPDEAAIDLGDAAILIFGMGRIGSGAYDVASFHQGEGRVLGIDFSRDNVDLHVQAGRRVLFGDATDFDFWHKVDLNGVQLIMLAMPNHQANMFALKELRMGGFSGPVTATAYFDDELAELRAAGASTAYNVYAEAGAGYGHHVCDTIGCAVR
ncbi:MAG: cation:proton antiporter family protein [Thermodesulfobacteriota bacterium]